MLFGFWCLREPSDRKGHISCDWGVPQKASGSHPVTQHVCSFLSQALCKIEGNPACAWEWTACSCMWSSQALADPITNGLGGGRRSPPPCWVVVLTPVCYNARPLAGTAALRLPGGHSPGHILLGPSSPARGNSERVHKALCYVGTQRAAL